MGNHWGIPEDLGRRFIYFEGAGEMGEIKETFWGFREQRSEKKYFKDLGIKVARVPASGDRKPVRSRNFIHTLGEKTMILDVV